MGPYGTIFPTSSQMIGFGGHRPVEELVADVVFRAGIAPKAHHCGGLRRVLNLAVDELAGDRYWPSA
jgi:hypothetical protein